MKPSSITNCFKIACLFYALTSYSQECSTQENIKVTFFGYPDNSTPGPKLTISCGPRQLIAGGIFLVKMSLDAIFLSEGYRRHWDLRRSR